MGRKRRKREVAFEEGQSQTAQLEADARAKNERLEAERKAGILAKEEQARDQVRTARVRQKTILTGGANRGASSSNTGAFTSLLGGR